MADLPILFSPPMVQGLLREIARPGKGKTQTRRLLNPQPGACDHRLFPGEPPRFVIEGRKTHCAVCGNGIELDHSRPDGVRSIALKYQKGDRLYVREPWRTFVSLDDVAPRDLLERGRGAGIAYEAGGGLSLGREPERAYTYKREDREAFGKFRQAMHLPRWGTRLTAIVTEVRVERLQDISRADALAEGIVEDDGSEPDIFYLPGASMLCGVNAPKGRRMIGDHPEPRLVYRDLINNLHGGDLWSANPWVAAYSLAPRLGNIDTLEGKNA